MTDTLTETLPGPDGGTIREDGDGWIIGFERRLRHSPERVWKALTTPEGLACWLAEADIETVPGGRMELHFRQPDNDFMPDVPEKRRQSNEVLTVRPYTLFEHTFGSNPDSVVSWRLEPDGDGTHLILAHRVPSTWESARKNVLAGWQHHMEGLEDAIHGVRHPWSWDRWFALRDAYAERLENPHAGDEKPYSNDWRTA